MLSSARHRAIEIYPVYKKTSDRKPIPTPTYELQKIGGIHDPFMSNTPPNEFTNTLKDRMRIYFTKGESSNE